jgi:hypothetical protein
LGVPRFFRDRHFKTAAERVARMTENTSPKDSLPTRIPVTEEQLAALTTRSAFSALAHPRVVMETLGHSQVSLTLDTYSHVLPGLQAEAAHRMQTAIGCQIGCQDSGEVPPPTPETGDSLEKVVSQTFASWNQIGHVLRRLEALRSAAGSAEGAIHMSKDPD